MVKSLSVSPDAGREPTASEIDLDVNPLKKQVSVFIMLPDYRLLRAEAARRRIPMSSLFLEWITPHLADLRRREANGPGSRHEAREAEVTSASKRPAVSN